MRPYLKAILVLKHFKRVCVFFEELKETQRNKGLSTKGNNIALQITILNHCLLDFYVIVFTFRNRNAAVVRNTLL